MINFLKRRKKKKKDCYNIPSQNSICLNWLWNLPWLRNDRTGIVWVILYITIDKKKTPHFWISLWIVHSLWNLHSESQLCAESREEARFTRQSEYRKWCKYPISFPIHLIWDFWSYFPKGRSITPQRLMLTLWVHWLLSTQYTMDETLKFAEANLQSRLIGL